MNWEYKTKQNEERIGALRVSIIHNSGNTEILNNMGYHSPDGFQIGYAGSGPADLAYSILTDYMIRSNNIDLVDIPGRVEIYHQLFKNDFIVEAKESLSIDSNTIKLWLDVQDNIDDKKSGYQYWMERLDSVGRKQDND